MILPPIENFIVTTSLRAGETQIELAKRLSNEIKATFVARDKKSIMELSSLWNAWGVLVVDSEKVICLIDQNEFYFHPAMAVVRIREIKSGKTDQMIKAMGLSPGQRLLDCTMGLGTDAIVASYILGDKGYLLGLEHSPVIATLVNLGLKKRYKKVNRDVYAAMGRINVKCCDHRNILAQLPENSFDIVYFDPMFRVPQKRSSGINAIRPLADDRPLTPGVMEMALRVASKRVVVKEGKSGNQLSKLGFYNYIGGKYSPVIYGYMDKNGC